ncbi:MAG: HAD family hydrolase [Aestuariivirga sp.]
MQHLTPKRKISLVIFDCDGVLVDSELLSASVLTQMMMERGLPINADIFRSEFLGRSFATASKRYEQHLSVSFPADFNMEYRSRLLARMKGNLHAMPGVERVLRAMKVPYCLATGSSPPRLAVSMSESALEPFFEGRSYTASDVKHGKPAPDLMFHAAKQMGVASDLCLVIEDSEMGLRAAAAAGMEVWRFVGGGHLKDGDMLPDDVVPQRVVDSMPALLDAFREIGIAE